MPIRVDTNGRSFSSRTGFSGNFSGCSCRSIHRLTPRLWISARSPARGPNVRRSSACRACWSLSRGWANAAYWGEFALSRELLGLFLAGQTGNANIPRLVTAANTAMNFMPTSLSIERGSRHFVDREPKTYRRLTRLRGGWVYWSGRPGSNRRHRPWQGRTLPAELLPLRGLFNILQRHCSEVNSSNCNKAF